MGTFKRTVCFYFSKKIGNIYTEQHITLMHRYMGLEGVVKGKQKR